LVKINNLYEVKMKIKKANLILFVMFVFCFNLVNANYYWSQEANANYESTIAGNNYIAYGSNYRNEYNMSYTTGEAFGNYTQEGINYTMCYMTNSDYTPVSADFNRDGILEVVLTDKSINKLSIYTTKCELIDEIEVEQTIQAMPVLLDVDSECINEDDPDNPIFELCAEFSPEIFVLTDEELKGYSYISAEGYFEEVVSLNYTNEVDAPLEFLTCYDPVAPKCFGLSSDHNDAILFNFVGEGNIIPVLNELISPDSLVEKSKYNGLSNTRIPTLPLEFYVPFGFYKSSPSGETNFYGNVLKGSGDYLFGYSVPYSYQISYSIDYIIDSSHFIAKQGNLFRLFTNQKERAKYYTGSQWIYTYYSTVAAFDLSGNRLFYDSQKHTIGKKVSNWAIADINKDGSNDACYLDLAKNLNCYHPALNWNLELTYNYSSLMGDNINLVLADFYSGYGWDELCIGTVEGIFCSGEKVYSTGQTGDGFPITVFKDTFSNIPALIYADDSQGFIVYPDIDVDSCGNDLCEYWENQLSCPQDCEEEFEPEEPEEPQGSYSEGSPCSSASDCIGNLQCVYKVCSKVGFNQPCTIDSECVSNDCVNGKCTKPTLWQGVDASKTEQFGDDTPTNNILSIILMLVIGAMIGYYINIWAGMMALFVLGIFFTMVGWLSGFILVGLFIVGVIAIVFGLMIAGQSH
jgi:hypothetical protein